MNKTTCIISLGSNTDADMHIGRAHELLTRAYPSIAFSPLVETAARGMQHNQSPFLNQVARLDTDQELAEVASALKVIERFCGRTPEDKANERIHIDIDLLAYGDTILKPMDFARYTTEINRLL